MEKDIQPIVLDQEFYQDFFEKSPLGFHSFGPDKKIISVNQRELEMLGYTKDEVIGQKTWGDLIIPSEREVFERHWQMINATGQVHDFIYTIQRKDGDIKRVIVNACAEFDSSGKLKYTRGIVAELKEQLSVKGEGRAEDIKMNIIMNLENFIFPLLDKLKKRSDVFEKKFLSVLEEKLLTLTEGFGCRISDKKWKFSRREIEICDLIKRGLATKEIAQFLFTSVKTIDHHRNRIRKKLGISKTSIDLFDYLKKF